MQLKATLLRWLAVRGNVTTGARFHVGPRSVIWAPSLLEIGQDVYIGKNVTIEIDGRIGDGTMIANAVNIVGRTDHDIHHIGLPIRLAPGVGDEPGRLSHRTEIGSDVWIGAGAVVLSGVSIGDSAVIGAGSVVTSDVVENSIVVGVPARKVGDRFSKDNFRAHWIELESAGYRRMTPASMQSSTEASP